MMWKRNHSVSAGCVPGLSNKGSALWSVHNSDSASVLSGIAGVVLWFLHWLAHGRACLPSQPLAACGQPRRAVQLLVAVAGQPISSWLTGTLLEVPHGAVGVRATRSPACGIIRDSNGVRNGGHQVAPKFFPHPNHARSAAGQGQAQGAHSL